MEQKKNILVLGSNGQLGQELKRHLAQQDYNGLIFADRSTIDISEEGSIDKILVLKPSIIINCAAYTAVDTAEKDAAAAMHINATSVGYLAKACNAIDAVLIHISSDYVYHGHHTMPIKEDSNTLPKGVYAVSKAKGDTLATQLHDKTIVLRCSWIYSDYGNNFVKTMLKLAQTRRELTIVNDQFGAPTYAKDIAIAIGIIISKIDELPAPYGIYNFANEGVTTWYDFAQYIFNNRELNMQLHGTTTAQYNAPAPRPRWSVMNLNKIKSTFHIDIRHWTNAVDEVLTLL
jgi:dTDP-4-dehydrorhamnose reductase